MSTPLSSDPKENSEQFVIHKLDGKPGGQGTSSLSAMGQSGDDWSANTSSLDDEEDYDRLQPNPGTLITGSRGGGLNIKTLDGANSDGGSVPFGSTTEKALEAFTASPAGSKTRIPLGGRRRSIQVTLEKTGKRGRYILTADDPEFREIMHAAIKKEASATDPNRSRFRDLVFTRRFTTFDRQNAASADSPFRGFFTLFWLCIVMMLVRVAALNWRTYGSVLGEAELLHMMFDRDIIVFGLTDGVMCLATAFGLILQKIIAREWLSWSKYGWIIQNLWQTFYLLAIITWTYYRDWPWQHTTFVLLHGFTFIMKQHSYAFYNGYLSQVFRRRRILQEKLQQLDEIDPVASPITSSRSWATSGAEVSDRSQSPELRRRKFSDAAIKTSTNLSNEKSEVSSIAAAIDSGEPLDEDQLDAFSAVIRSEIKLLTEELTGKAASEANAYPNNLTVGNWFDWTCLPTLVYELEYPRQETRNWYYIAEKTLATFGCIWVMMVVSQAYIYPSVLLTVQMKESGMTLQERWNEFPWIVGDMLFPLLLEQLMTWYVLWECVLNVLAEITLFADRGFYGDWWNSTSWDQYARDWNRPVHTFLLRHVYHSSISTFKLSKGAATFVTFLLSACVHELVMLCIFRKVRGYLFAMQLLQIPLAAMSRTRLMKGRNVLGNVVFWFGLFVGPSIITALYLIV